MEIILQISDERLEELASQIRPVVRFKAQDNVFVKDESGGLFYIENVDLRKTTFLWASKATAPAEGLIHYASIRTYHSCGVPFRFKPSIAEVIAQIPEEDIGRIVAFEIPGTTVDESLLNIPNCLTDKYHWVTTKLYEKR